MFNTLREKLICVLCEALLIVEAPRKSNLEWYNRNQLRREIEDPNSESRQLGRVFAHFFSIEKSEVENKNPDLIGRDLNHLRNKLR